MLETVRLFNRLNADVNGVEGDDDWADMLIAVIRSPTGFKSSSSHYWGLLGKLMITARYVWWFVLDDMGVMRSLEKAKD